MGARRKIGSGEIAAVEEVPETFTVKCHGATEEACIDRLMKAT